MREKKWTYLVIMAEKNAATHFLIVPYAIPERCTATYYPETNVLVPINSVAEKAIRQLQINSTHQNKKTSSGELKFLKSCFLFSGIGML
jgi:hypothetical protein